MRITKVLAAVALALLWAGAGCESILFPSDVRIRVENASAIDFSSTTIGFPSETEQYGAVPAGGRTDYRPVSRAYRYAFAEVEAAGRRYVLQPIDYVGEELLDSGSYTYSLDVDPQTGGVSLRLVED
jgi:hypothetical protein